MIAPEPAPVINKQTSRLGLLRNNLLVSGLIFFALEFWRPYFFLTDDNLDGGFPFFIEVGQQLLSGHSPFIGPHLFGGHYNFLHDPSYFVWHPVYLLVSLLAGTPLRFTIIDVDAFFMLMLATAGFVTLAHYVRRTMGVKVSDGWIMFYALSYTYTMIALTTGASWLTFLGNHSALPWLVLGVLQGTKRGVGIVALFTLHQILGGHLAPTVSNSIFLSLFAAGMAWRLRSWQPLINWLGGYVIALVLVLPLLVPMLEGFFSSIRSQGVTLEDMQANNIPAMQFPTSIFLGMALWLIHPHEHPYVTYTLALGSSAAVWCLLPALAGGIYVIFKYAARVLRVAGYQAESDHLESLAESDTGLENWRPLEIVTLGLMAFGAVLICRPLWITQVMMHLPLFRSMRWPFREFVQFQFFLHFFLVVRPPGLSVISRKASAVFGTLMFVIPMVLFPLPPTFNAMTWDRELIIHGGYERYWAQVRPLLKPTDRIAVLIPLNLYEDDRFEEPYTLLGTYNYAVLADVVNTWGYSPTAPRNQVYTKTYAAYPFGAYFPEQKAALLAEMPDLKFITLESLRPLKITLSSRDGPTIDLTPFVPERQSKIPAEAALLHDGEAKDSPVSK